MLLRENPVQHHPAFLFRNRAGIEPEQLDEFVGAAVVSPGQQTLLLRRPEKGVDRAAQRVGPLYPGRLPGQAEQRIEHLDGEEAAGRLEL